MSGGLSKHPGKAAALGTGLLAIFLLSLCGSLAAGAQAPAAGEQPRHEERGCPVTLDGELLYTVRIGLGPYSAEERAALATKRIEKIAEDPFFRIDLIEIQAGKDRSDIYYRAMLVGTITEEDAAGTGKTGPEMAEEVVQNTKKAIADYRQRRMPQARVRGYINIAVATLCLALLFFGLRWTQRRLMKWVEARRIAGLTLKIQQRVVLDPDRLAAQEIRALRIFRWGLTLLFGFVYLQVAFSFIPLTRGFAISILAYVLEPLKLLWSRFVNHIGDFFFIAVVVVLTRYLLKLLRWVHGEAAQGNITLPGIHPEWAMSFYKVIRLAVIALAAVVIYPYIPGSSTAAFKGISLFAGAVVTLGSSGAASNFVSGLILMFMRSFRVGDRVKIGEATGDVVETSLLLTRLRTIKNEEVTIPNATVLGSYLVNYSTLAKAEGVILYTSVTIGYDAPWRTVHELLTRAALRTGRILREPAPFVLQTALSDFYVCYQINAYTRDANDMANIYAELHQNIQDCFFEAGVEIMSPHYTSMRDGNTVAIPEKFRPEGYAPRPFGVRVDPPGGGKKD